MLKSFVCLVTLTHAQTRPNYGAFSLQISFPVLVFSRFTHFSFAPFAFSARQTGRRLEINVKKKEITKQFFFYYCFNVSNN